MKFSKITKRGIGAALAFTTAFAFTACDSSSTSEETTSSDTSEPAVDYSAEAFEGIEPLATATPLSIGFLSSSTHGFNNYLIEKLGGYEYANIDEELIVFGNGPILVEAMASGSSDVGVYGLGGTLAGTIGQNFVNLAAASRDYHALQFYSPNDSELVTAGASEIGIYGTAEDWKGREIFLPLGTTLHYMLSQGLEKMGLTTDDVKLTHMEVPNINTALRVGKADVGGVWTNYPYGDLNETATAVMTAEQAEVILLTCLATTQENLDDATKSEAIQKWMELYFAAIDWMYENDENYNQAVEWFMEWNEDNGIAGTVEEVLAHTTYQKCYTLEENIEMINTMSENGDYNAIVDANVEPLKFFVSQGNYTEEDLVKFQQPEYFDFTLIEAIANK